jgi:hypothetical protein
MTEADYADSTIAAVNVTSTMCNTPIRDRSNVIFITGIVAGTIALAAVSVRTLSAILQDSFGLDDVFALAAEAACLPVTVIQCTTPKLGFGKDTWVVPQQNIYKVLRVRQSQTMLSRMLIICVVDLRLSNQLLRLPRANQARISFLLSPHLPLCEHKTPHLGRRRRLGAVHYRIRCYDDICMSAYLSSMDFLGRNEESGLLHQPEHLLPGSRCAQHRSRRGHCTDPDSGVDQTEPELAQESLPQRHLWRRRHVSHLSLLYLQAKL